MLISPFERFLLHCELDLEPYRKRGVPLKLIEEGERLDAFTLIGRGWKGEKGRLELGPQDVVRITAVEHDASKGLVTILFRRGDPKASAQVYENMKTGRLRKSDKTEEDIVAVSCHLFIETRARAGNRYRAALEEVPSLGRTYVQRILTNLVSEHRYTATDEKGREKESYTRASLDGIKSDSLGKSGGTFDYIELTRSAEAEGLDIPFVVPRQETMKLKIQAGAPDVVQKITAVRDWATRNKWSDVKVRLNLPEGRSRLIAIGRDAQAADVLFVRSVPVAIKTPMEVCSDDINGELLSLAKDQFDNHWK
jgi:hypothetical protein